MSDSNKRTARARRAAARFLVGDLTKRLDRLEAEVDECRRLHLRLAELTDVVQELLVPLAQSDPERAQEILDRYSDELGS